VLLLALTASHAFAQSRPCDQWRSNTTTGASAITEKVAAVAGKRIYLCGFVLIHSGTSADFSFQLLTGTGRDCVSNQSVLLNSIPMPPNTVIVNRIPFATGESTPPGQAVCVQTFGTGSLTTIFYWAQF
jgi:hypothetical protein